MNVTRYSNTKRFAKEDKSYQWHISVGKYENARLQLIGYDLHSNRVFVILAAHVEEDPPGGKSAKRVVGML